MQRTHYEILGVARDATPDQIKRRFRALARQHHPDVATDKAASHQAFVLISEAYRVLIDPLRRADYDLMLRDRERRPPSSSTGPRPRPDATRPPRPGAASGPSSAEGAGGHGRGTPGTQRSWVTGRGGPAPGAPWAGSGGARRTPGPASGSSRRPDPSARGASASRSRPATPDGQPAPGSRPRSDINQLLRSAQAAFAGMRYRDAIQYLQAVLKLDPRNAGACSLLGDVYRFQGRIDEAIRFYSYAIQFNPSPAGRAMVQEKLDRLLAREATRSRPQPAGNGAAARPHRGRRYSPRLTRRQVNQRMFLGAFGFALALFLMLIVEHTPGQPITDLPWISHWTAPLLWMMVLDGVLVGATLSLANMVRPIDEELLLPSVARGSSGVPVGLLLTLIGGMFFYAGVVMYTLIGLLQESFSLSVLMVFLSTFALVVCFAFLAPERAAGQVMLFGGNVIFVSMLAGWFLGDLFRPLWS